jgi:hypothetical protein
MSIGTTSGLGKLTGTGHVTRADGTIEPFVIDVELTSEESESIEENLQQQNLDSQE